MPWDVVEFAVASTSVCSGPPISISDAVCSLLNFTEAERSAVDGILEHCFDARIRSERKRVERLDSGSAPPSVRRFLIPADNDEFRQLLRDLQDSLVETVGEARGDLVAQAVQRHRFFKPMDSPVIVEIDEGQAAGQLLGVEGGKTFTIMSDRLGDTAVRGTLWSPSTEEYYRFGYLESL